MSMSIALDQLTEDQGVDVRLLAKNCNEVLAASNVDPAKVAEIIRLYVGSLHQMWLPDEIQEFKAERFKVIEEFEANNQPFARQAAVESLQETLDTDPASVEVRERAMLALRGRIKPQYLEVFDRIVGYEAPAPRDDDFSEQAYVQVERQGRKAVVARSAIDKFMSGVRRVGDLISA